MDPDTGVYTYTLSTIRNDCVVAATFDKIYFTVTASSESTDTDDDADSSPYEISSDQTAVACGEDHTLQIQESSFGAGCYDFQLTITPEGGESVVV